MRVLHVINSLQLGGAEVLLRHLVPQLRTSGVDTEIYLLNSDKTPLLHDVMADGAVVYFSGHHAVYRPAGIFDLAKHLRNSSYDLIHVHLFPAQLWTPLAACWAGKRIPLVTTEHSTFNRRRKSLFRPLDWWMYKQYAAIACISHATASALTHWLPGLGRKIHVIPNGIPIERFRDALALSREQITGSAVSPIVLFVARFEAGKDHPTVMRALTKVPQAQLVLVGDGPLRAEMEKLSMSLGIADRVHFLGRRQDVPQLIKMADVYVHASHWEGFGIAALEAMAGGLPVVASRVPGLMDVVGEAGLLFGAGDHHELSTLLNSVLSTPQARTELVRRGLSRAKDYSIQQTARRYIALYRDVLSV